MSFSSPVERYLFSDRLRKPNLSRSFIEFIKKLVVAKDEFNVISAELHSINERLSNPNIGKNELRYVLITMIYFEILGHSAESCGYMSALMLCQKSDSIQDKRLAYLALTLFLHPQHELTIMLVNTITKDLSTDDEATISCGLLLASHLLNPQTIPIILPKIESLLQHRNSKIREHSLSTINHILKRSPSPSSMTAIFRLLPTLKLTLFDRSPVVVLSTLHILSKLLSCSISQVDSNTIEDKLPMSIATDLINGVSSILKYILDTGLDKNYEYHGVSAPWIQVECLKILGLAGQYVQYEESATKPVVDLIMYTLVSAQQGVDMTFAITLQCFRSLSSLVSRPSSTSPSSPSISGQSQLSPSLHACGKISDVLRPHFTTLANVTNRYMLSPNNNLKFLGLQLFSNISRISALLYASLPRDALSVEDKSAFSEHSEVYIKLTNDVLNMKTNDESVELFRLEVMEQLHRNQAMAMTSPEKAGTLEIFNASSPILPTVSALSSPTPPSPSTVSPLDAVPTPASNETSDLHKATSSQPRKPLSSISNAVSEDATKQLLQSYSDFLVNISTDQFGIKKTHYLQGKITTKISELLIQLFHPGSNTRSPSRSRSRSRARTRTHSGHNSKKGKERQSEIEKRKEKDEEDRKGNDEERGERGEKREENDMTVILHTITILFKYVPEWVTSNVTNLLLQLFDPDLDQNQPLPYRSGSTDDLEPLLHELLNLFLDDSRIFPASSTHTQQNPRFTPSQQRLPPQTISTILYLLSHYIHHLNHVDQDVTVNRLIQIITSSSPSSNYSSVLYTSLPGVESRQQLQQPFLKIISLEALIVILRFFCRKLEQHEFKSDIHWVDVRQSLIGVKKVVTGELSERLVEALEVFDIFFVALRQEEEVKSKNVEEDKRNNELIG